MEEMTVLPASFSSLLCSKQSRLATGYSVEKLQQLVEQAEGDSIQFINFFRFHLDVYRSACIWQFPVRQLCDILQLTELNERLNGQRAMEKQRKEESITFI